ncbi:LamG domain-containing protein [archaeon]|nr:LamG domain-containing protein [archaeon]
MAKKMNGGFHKSISVVFTLAVIVMLVFLGPASAVQVILSQPSDITQGQAVSFDITVEFDNPDQYLPIQYTDIIFTGPNDFEETCRVYNDGSYDNCDLNIDVTVSFDTGYGDGLGFGYDYNDGNYYNFGEGYGYGYGYYGTTPEISYNIIWHTPSGINPGEYEVRADMYAIGEDQYQDYYGFSYCGAMEGMYIEWLSLNPQGTDYDSNLDLYPDGKIDISDIIIFSMMRESGCVFDEHYGNGLVLWMPMNGDLNDYSGKGNHGSCNGDACPVLTSDVAGKENSAYNFDGINDVVVIEDNDELDLTEDYTISAWVRFDSLDETFRNVLSKEYYINDGENAGYAIEKYMYDNLFYVTYDNSDPSTNHVSADAQDEWVQLVVTYDKASKDLMFYVNEELVDINEDAVSPGAYDTDLHIGASSALTRFFKGDIDDLRIYNKVLDAGEISTVYDSQFSNNDCSVLYGRFLEFFRIQGSDGEYNEDLDLDGDGDVDFDDLLIFIPNREESWCADQVAILYEAVSHAFASSTQTFNIDVPVQSTGGGGSVTGTWVPQNETEEENNTTEESVIEEAEEFVEQQTTNENTGVFDAITGAVVGVGDTLGIGTTLAYLFLCLIFICGIIVISRKIDY